MARAVLPICQGQRRQLADRPLNIAWQHLSPAWSWLRRDGQVGGGVRWRAALSSLLWLCVLLAGRWIGFP
jgi:hypothetical protein